MHGREKFLTPAINSASSIINVSLGPATGSSFSGEQIPAIESVALDSRGLCSGSPTSSVFAPIGLLDDKLVSCCEAASAAAAAGGDPVGRLH